jgi:hypothetical protein
MAAKKPPQTLADYVTIALSPVLIMALVGSLVFFLLEILYVGQYPDRMKWTLFFFVFGAVLIARISMENDLSGRAGLYGLALGAAVYLALMSFIDFSAGGPAAAFGWAINLVLMGIIWWCAHRLTWDCTHIDDMVDASGKGVLDAAGLDKESQAPPAAADEEADEKAPAQPGLLGWWQRYRRYREEQQRKPHTPGVWVVYFSLAALPMFGLGQALIPAADAERRRYVFWLMGVYVASGLGLLVTTSFLGLRRYLRQRKLQMPAALTGVWLAIGAALIGGLLLIGALLPRPSAEYALIQLSPAGSKDREASRFAVQRDDPGKGEGRSSTSPPPADAKATSGSGTKSDRDGSPGKARSSSPSSGKSGQRDGSGSGNRQGRQGSGQSQGKSDGKASGSGSNQDDRNEDANEQKKAGDNRGSGAEGSSPAPSRNPVSSVLSALSGPWVTVLKWIVFGILALVVAFVVLRAVLQFLANFTGWARGLLAALEAWWQGLFGGGRREGDADAAAEDLAVVRKPRPFASFRNPFLDGSADQRPPDELVRYSFDALQAWAWERDWGRQPEETPLEFAERLGRDVPGLEAESRGLAGLYARVVYARGSVAASSVNVLRQFWQRLESVEDRPLSA